MKVGDLVRNMKFPMYEGIVVDVMSYHGLIKVRSKRDEVYAFSPDQLEVVNKMPERWVEETLDKELTDEQLEQVQGGMSPQKFNAWRAEKINESR
jgi:bacteriocin-like protein